MSLVERIAASKSLDSRICKELEKIIKDLRAQLHSVVFIETTLVVLPRPTASLYFLDCERPLSYYMMFLEL